MVELMLWRINLIFLAYCSLFRTTKEISRREKDMAREINLKELFQIIRRRIWIVIIMTIFGIMSGYILSVVLKATPLYYSSTRMVIGADDNTMSTLKVLMKDSTVLDEVSKELRFTRTPGMLAQEITVGDIDSSKIVSLSVIDDDPNMAAQIANVTASVFKSEAENVLNFNDIRLLAAAQANPIPINPPNNHKIIYTTIFGLIVGIGLVFFLNSLDDSIQSEKELEKILGAPVLGRVAKMKKKNMSARRKTHDIRKNTVELTNMLQIETKKGKLAYKRKKEDLTYNNANSIHRIQQ